MDGQPSIFYFIGMDKKLRMLPVEVSARHVHLSQEDQDILFGEGYEMTIKKELSQTGQWAAEERVVVRGPKDEVKCTVLGPCRKQTQVEFAFSDGFRMGIEVPVKESGHLGGSAGCTLIGPKGEVELKEGVINPQRHLHIRDTEAEERGLEHHDILTVHIEHGKTSLSYFEMIVRVHPTFRMNIHLDTDEGNACSIPMHGTQAKIVKIVREGKEVYRDAEAC